MTLVGVERHNAPPTQLLTNIDSKKHTTVSRLKSWGASGHRHSWFGRGPAISQCDKTAWSVVITADRSLSRSTIGASASSVANMPFPPCKLTPKRAPTEASAPLDACGERNRVTSFSLSMRSLQHPMCRQLSRNPRRSSPLSRLQQMRASQSQVRAPKPVWKEAFSWRLLLHSYSGRRKTLREGGGSGVRPRGFRTLSHTQNALLRRTPTILTRPPAVVESRCFPIEAGAFKRPHAFDPLDMEIIDLGLRGRLGTGLGERTSSRYGSR